MNVNPILRIREFDAFCERFDTMTSDDDSRVRCRRSVKRSVCTGNCYGSGEGPVNFGTTTKGREESAGFGCNGSVGGGETESGMKRRKLVLHFDIRNTILVADSVTKVNMEQALNTFLTGVTWGTSEGHGGWAWLSDVPSLGPPCPGAVTYYKYLEGQLARDPDDRARLRQATGDFTQTERGKMFRSHFDKHLRLLEWHHEEEGTSSDRRLTMVGPGNRRYHYLLPSFIRLISKLHADGRDFAIVLRTYGMDASNVLSCIRHIVAGNHPLVPRNLPISVDVTPGAIHRLDDGRIRCERYENTDEPTAPRKTVYGSESDIYKLLSESNGILGFVDDFGHWQRSNYGHRAGKPLWVDPRDDRVQHIFFDDNIRVSADDSIVDVRLPGTDHRRGGFESVVDSEEMANFENACLVQADLLHIITDIDYFVEKVKACEVNYDDLIKRVSSARNNS